MRILSTVVVLALLGARLVSFAAGPDEKLWAAARRGNAVKVAKLLEGGVTNESRLVALSVSAAANQPETFTLLWNPDDPEVAAAALDDALCYAHRNSDPAPVIREVLDRRALTIDACCGRSPQQPFCAGRPILLADESFPATRCDTVFIEESQLPPGALRIATLWDERLSVLDPSASARYGLPGITPAGVTDWAMEFAPALGALGADAILISLAERNVASRSAVQRYPTPQGDDVDGFTFGAVTDRIEIVAIRRNP